MGVYLITLVTIHKQNVFVRISNFTHSSRALGRLLEKKNIIIENRVQVFSRVERQCMTHEAFLWLEKGP